MNERMKKGEKIEIKTIYCVKDYFFFKLKENWVLSEISYLGISISILACEIIGFKLLFFVFWEAYPYPFFY